MILRLRCRVDSDGRVRGVGFQHSASPKDRGFEKDGKRTHSLRWTLYQVDNKQYISTFCSPTYKVNNGDRRWRMRLTIFPFALERAAPNELRDMAGSGVTLL